MRILSMLLPFAVICRNRGRGLHDREPVLRSGGTAPLRTAFATIGVSRENGFWKWKWESWRDGLPKPPANGYRFPMATVEAAFASNAASRRAWIVTTVAAAGGHNILTDPHPSERASRSGWPAPSESSRGHRLRTVAAHRCSADLA
jgi:hypothetical protein